MAHRSYGTTTLPDGFAHTMNRAEINIVYPTFPEEVHDLVGRMLGSSEDEIQAVHGFIDTPVLAAQSIAMNIGSHLPVYDRIAFSDMAEVDRTKLIEREDTFAIAKGPTYIGNRPSPHFSTVLERVVVQKPVEEPEPARDPTMLRTLFRMAASVR